MPTAEPPSEQGALLVSRGWVQASVLVVLFGFFVLGRLAYRTYVAGPPIPGRVVSSEGALVHSREDVQAGQRSFLRNGPMEYGSIFGHGAYLGPDFTADYLHRAALISLEAYRRAGAPDRSARLRTTSRRIATSRAPTP